MTDIRVPTLGESVTEATVGKWFKKAGDTVRADEVLAELETDKVTLEVNAPASGVLAEITVKEGATVTPGALLGQITEGVVGATQPAPVAASKPAPVASPAPLLPIACQTARSTLSLTSRTAPSPNRACTAPGWRLRATTPPAPSPPRSMQISSRCALPQWMGASRKLAWPPG